jgi:hypothetical protein
LLSPEPGPVGVNVDPLGEALGPRVFPDGFIVLFGPPADAPLAFPMPVVPPVAPAPTDEPLLVPLAAVPPAAEPPPAEPPLLCASANVLDSANAVAKAIVVSFMGWFLVDDWHDNSPSRSSVPTPLRETSCALGGAAILFRNPGPNAVATTIAATMLVVAGSTTGRSRQPGAGACLCCAETENPDPSRAPSRGRLIVAIDVNRAVVQSLAR